MLLHLFFIAVTAVANSMWAMDAANYEASDDGETRILKRPLTPAEEKLIMATANTTITNCFSGTFGKSVGKQWRDELKKGKVKKTFSYTKLPDQTNDSKN